MTSADSDLRGGTEMVPLHLEFHDDHENIILTVNAKTKDKRSPFRICLPHTAARKSSEESSPSYMRLLRENRPFLLFFVSYITSHLGEWLTYLASIAALEHMHKDEVEGLPKTMISTLIIMRLIPSVLLGPLGGVLADGRDRRQSMIVLDLSGSVIGGLFILAVQMKCVWLVYVATFVQQCVAGLYEPCRTSIIPLLAPEGDELKMATTITSLAWSLVAAIGSSAGGLFVSLLGLQACFVIDSATYLMSAWLMFLIPGSFNVLEETEQTHDETLWKQVHRMFLGGVWYLRNSFFGALVLLKASAAIAYGGCDVLNVAFSERGDPAGESSRLGVLFACVGVGCLFGPIFFDPFTDMDEPRSLQKVCVTSMALISLGCILMGIFDRVFWMTCFFTALRSMGSSVLWINSTLALQKFSSDEKFGRVASIDYSLALLTESLSVYVTGYLMDEPGFSPEAVSVMLGVAGVLLTLCWAVYDYLGKGAASYECNVKASSSETDSTTESSTASESMFLIELEEM